MTMRIFILCFSMLGMSATQAQKSAGDVASKDLAFSVFDADGKLQPRTLADFSESIILLYYYAPW